MKILGLALAFVAAAVTADLTPAPDTRLSRNPPCVAYCPQILRTCDRWLPAPYNQTKDFCLSQNTQCESWCDAYPQTQPRTSNNGTVMEFPHSNNGQFHCLDKCDEVAYSCPQSADPNEEADCVALDAKCRACCAKDPNVEFHMSESTGTIIFPPEGCEIHGAGYPPPPPPAKRQSEICKEFCSDACGEKKLECAKNGGTDCETQYQQCFPYCYDTWCDVIGKNAEASVAPVKRHTAPQLTQPLQTEKQKRQACSDCWGACKVKCTKIWSTCAAAGTDHNTCDAELGACWAPCANSCGGGAATEPVEPVKRQAPDPSPRCKRLCEDNCDYNRYLCGKWTLPVDCGEMYDQCHQQCYDIWCPLLDAQNPQPTMPPVAK